MLKNKVALVTGGTGGIGEKICEAFAQRGANIAFTYHRNEEKAGLLQKSLEQQGRRVLAAKVSVLDKPGVDDFVQRVGEELGPIDILVNNAAITQVMPFALIEEDDWDRVMAINVKGVFMVTKAVVRGMIRRKCGNIVNLCSIAGQRLLEVPVHYATSKSAILGFTTSLAKELCRYGIRVNAVSPGFVDVGVGTNLTESQRREYVKYCSLGRSGKAEEVAELVVFLASEQSSFINAQNIVIDGGL
ncbi:MAG: 3-oxoacyl-ACP reductase FabG [Cyanobacteria bacterium NC_groundwater_1444_Ag_S-0.65um_54_12]|nr:3-oxoacyl-ACP reductase FabG [Cyanobacteria bacterium NC_groundwater_1444_Ag_S-0.65um_54_12]